MSRFLWVEDFGGDGDGDLEVTVQKVFPEISLVPFPTKKEELREALKAHGIYLELDFQDGLSFINSDLNKVDYIVLDIYLPCAIDDDELKPETVDILEKFYLPAVIEIVDEDERLNKAKAELEKYAGFHLYNELVVERGFPKDKIQFCSNHGDDMDSIRNAFESAKMQRPEIYTKSNVGIQEWTKECFNNKYSRLRRGIIEGCSILRKELTDDQQRCKELIIINNLINQENKKLTFRDVINYLATLETFLPLREPPGDEKRHIFRLFVRELACNWDIRFISFNSIKGNDKELTQALFAFSNIMKMVRNWSSHGNIFSEVKENDLAYFFIINLRAMLKFESVEYLYEKYLLELFSQDYSSSISEIPLQKKYALLLKEKGADKSSINFHEILNGLQNNQRSDLSPYKLITGLYQTFWFLTSRGSINTKSSDDDNFLKYTFTIYDYQKINFIFDLAKSIHKRSFY